MSNISKVSFYVLNESTKKTCDLYTCRIIEKAYSNNHDIYIYTSTPEEAQNMDTQLWTFRDISFIPHEIYNQNQEHNAQISIGFDQTPNQLPNNKNDILVNLTLQIPTFYQQFNHIIEVIPNNDEIKLHARKKYQIYRQNKLTIETFNITI